MQTWRYIPALALLVGLFGACDLSPTTEQSITQSVFNNPEAPALCFLPDHSSRVRFQFQSSFRGPEPWRLPTCVGEAMANIVWHYTNTLFWLVPFIGAWRLPPPAEQCIPALVVYLYPAMFAVSQAAPTPTPVVNPYNSQGGIARTAAHASRRTAPTSGRQQAPAPAPAAAGSTRGGAGRPPGTTNAPGSQKTGPDALTAANKSRP